MGNDRRLRRLTAGDTTWLWSVRHRHGDCREILSLHKEGADTVLRIVFRAGAGRFVAEGAWYAGCVMTDHGDLLNLREPRVVRGLLEVARGHGALPVAPGETELDGWLLLDAPPGIG
ncbi:hypothetical protein [Streptomyces sp. NBC_00344]|uniref:hypothetical protein n=1 Tax=Streptomyces sp. NBC_00344 TaxID=2975720 RepID=UPI002E1F9719